MNIQNSKVINRIKMYSRKRKQSKISRQSLPIIHNWHSHNCAMGVNAVM